MEITSVIQQMADANVSFQVRKRGWSVKDLTIVGDFEPEIKKALAVIVGLVDRPTLAKSDRIIHYKFDGDYPVAEVALVDILPIAKVQIAEIAAYEQQSVGMGFASAEERADFEHRAFWKMHNL